MVPALELMKKFPVDASAENVFVPAPRKMRLLKALVPVIALAIVCASVLANVVVPELCLKAPDAPRVKVAPPRVSKDDGAVTVPAVMVKLPVEVAEFAPKVHKPFVLALNVRLLNADDVATISFVAVEVELKVRVPVCVKILVDDANQLPAKAREFAPMERIEVVAVPSCRSPVARRRSPSGFTVPLFPWRVTAPPGANSEPGAIYRDVVAFTASAPAVTRYGMLVFEAPS